MAPPAGPFEIETLDKPTLYSAQQIDLACAICQALARGKLVLCEPPRR